MNPVILPKTRYLIGLILLLALLLRLPLLNSSFWLDEAAQAFESIRPIAQQLDLPHDFQPPLYHLVVHLLTYFSYQEWWLRLASLLPGLITVYLTFLFGRQLHSPKTGLMSASLFATSQLHLFYSQELRPYSLATLFGLLSSYLYYLWLKNPKLKYKLGYLVTSAAGLYTVYTFPFLLLGHLSFTLIKTKKQLPQHLLLLFGTVMLFTPWLPQLYRQLQTGLSLTKMTPGWDVVVSLPLLKTLPLTLLKFAGGRIEVDYSVITLSLFLVVAFVWLIRSLQTRREKTWPFLMIIISATLLTAYVVHTAVPIIEPKRFLFLLPLAYLALALPPFTQVATRLLALIVAVNLLATVLYWTIPQFHREPWREAVNQVESLAMPHAAVVMAFNKPFAPWRWYQTQNLPVFTTGLSPVANTDDLQTTLKPILATDQVVYFDYLSELTDPQRHIPAWLASKGYQESGFLQYPNLGKITFYRRGQVYASINP